MNFSSSPGSHLLSSNQTSASFHAGEMLFFETLCLLIFALGFALLFAPVVLSELKRSTLHDADESKTTVLPGSNDNPPRHRDPLDAHKNPPLQKPSSNATHDSRLKNPPPKAATGSTPKRQPPNSATQSTQTRHVHFAEASNQRDGIKERVMELQEEAKYFRGRAEAAENLANTLRRTPCTASTARAHPAVEPTRPQQPDPRVAELEEENRRLKEEAQTLRAQYIAAEMSKPRVVPQEFPGWPTGTW